MKKEIIEDIIQFRNDRDWKQFHTPENLAKAISIEAGELLECFQWGSKYDLKETSEELADVIIYAVLMADAMGVDMDEITRKKLEKNGLKYPVNKSKGNSTKYTKL